MMVKSPTADLVALLGSKQRVADGLGLTLSQVNRQLSGHSPQPEYVAAVYELLVLLPPKDWPKRWR